MEEASELCLMCLGYCELCKRYPVFSQPSSPGRGWSQTRRWSRVDLEHVEEDPGGCDEKAASGDLVRAELRTAKEKADRANLRNLITHSTREASKASERCHPETENWGRGGGRGFTLG